MIGARGRSPRAVAGVAAAVALATGLVEARAHADPPIRYAPESVKTAVDPEAPPATYDIGPGGRRFRVTFDPASRVWLGVAGAVARAPGSGVTGGFEIDAGLGYRNRSATGDGKDRVAWQVDHRIVAGWVRPLPNAGGVPPLDGALYGVRMLRHDASPSIVLPTSPPVGIPFPFDIGLDAEVGRFTTLSYAGLNAVRVGVVKGAILLDPWRSGAPGRSLAFGVGARYDVETSFRGGASVVHRVAPMTDGTVRFRFQSGDGLAVIDARGDVVPHFTSEGGWKLLAESSLRVERTLIALADQPVAAFLDGGYRYDPPRHDAGAVNDFRVSLGFTMNLNLR